MAHKRPYDDEVVYEGTSKHQRQDGPGGEITLCNDSFSEEDFSEKPCDSVEGKSDVPRSASDCSARPAINIDDVHYCSLDYPPRKQVPVGPDHQADIPCWGTQEKETTSVDSRKAVLAASGRSSTELDGICIMPNPEPLPYNGKKLCDGRTECRCLDQGSIRCVRQHIAEARDKLMRTFGQDTFMELGFNDMGEVVAEKWSEEEEELFHEAVCSNPASLGRNFWNALSAVFPSRTKMEFVSYYFNVIMLRKRAEQNRRDPLNIDSDNDEWQGSDEGGVSEEDGVESPVHDGLVFHENEDDGYLSEEGFAWTSDPESSLKLTGENSNEGDGGGSWTSSDSRAPVQGEPSDCQEWSEYIMELSDEYNMCSENHIDFLPTCSMIEEIFGEGDLDSKCKRW